MFEYRKHISNLPFDRFQRICLWRTIYILFCSAEIIFMFTKRHLICLIISRPVKKSYVNLFSLFFAPRINRFFYERSFWNVGVDLNLIICNFLIYFSLELTSPAHLQMKFIWRLTSSTLCFHGHLAVHLTVFRPDPSVASRQFKFIWSSSVDGSSGKQPLHAAICLKTVELICLI